MRKWTACILAALCVFGLFGCGAKSVPSLDEVKDYAPVDYEERFKGVTREALTEVWGEPADGGALQSADMWAIDDVSSVIIYWDADGSVQGGSIRPVEYHGRYEEDADICIIRSVEDMDDSAAAEAYEAGKLLLVLDWSLAEKIEEMVSPVPTSSFSADDAAVLFCHAADGRPITSTVCGNAGDWDDEIDHMIEAAKEK